MVTKKNDHPMQGVVVTFLDQTHFKYSIQLRGLKECVIKMDYDRLRNVKQYLKSHNHPVDKFPKRKLWKTWSPLEKEILAQSQLSNLEQVTNFAIQISKTISVVVDVRVFPIYPISLGNKEVFGRAI
jgi:hypothetical protein